MPNSRALSARVLPVCAVLGAFAGACHALPGTLPDRGALPDQEPALPRSLTRSESALIEQQPIVAEGLAGFMLRGEPEGGMPAGRVVCPPEYAPM